MAVHLSRVFKLFSLVKQRGLIAEDVGGEGLYGDVYGCQQDRFVEPEVAEDPLAGESNTISLKP